MDELYDIGKLYELMMCLYQVLMEFGYYLSISLVLKDEMLVLLVSVVVVGFIFFMMEIVLLKQLKKVKGMLQVGQS